MSEDKKTFLSRDTFVPITAVAAVVIVVLYVANIAGRVDAQAQRVDILERKQTSLEMINNSLLDRTARIETKLDILIERNK